MHTIYKSNYKDTKHCLKSDRTFFSFFFRWIASNVYCLYYLYCFCQKHRYLFSFFFCWITSNCFVCYFWLDPKVTKRSRLNRTGYSGRRLRCRLRNSLRSNSAGSGRYAFTLRFTPVRLGLSQKAELSLMIADTACFSFPFPFPFASPFLFPLYLPVISFASPFCFLVSPSYFLLSPFCIPP